MKIFDVIHGYQPFARDLMSPWVKSNLDDVFLPTSAAMADGLIRRNVQLQGWTINEWLNASPTIRRKAQDVLNLLFRAKESDNIELGFSAYSHAFLPLLSEELMYAQMRADREVIEEYLGPPSFFWSPEAAYNQRLLEVLSLRFPNTIAVLPTGCLNNPSSDFGLLKTNTISNQRVAVGSTLLKDFLMNGSVYHRPVYAPKKLDWTKAANSMREASALLHTIDCVDKNEKDFHVVIRDWENGESRDALVSIGKRKEIGAFLEMKDKIDFKLLSEVKYVRHIGDLSNCQSSCWEPLATEKNPFPYWTPKYVRGAKRDVRESWLALINLYDEVFRKIIFGGEDWRKESLNKRLSQVDEALNQKEFFKMFIETSPTLLSCLPWHCFARDEWERFPGFPIKLTERLLKPLTNKLISYGKKEAGLKLTSEERKLHSEAKKLISAIKRLPFHNP
ncbi:MAG: hypothetical protein ABH950_03750 [Candidatus Altiarchaeota archaeon]